jgi:hypothetical protein
MTERKVYWDSLIEYDGPERKRSVVLPTDIPVGISQNGKKIYLSRAVSNMALMPKETTDEGEEIEILPLNVGIRRDTEGKLVSRNLKEESD